MWKLFGLERGWAETLAYAPLDEALERWVDQLVDELLAISERGVGEGVGQYAAMFVNNKLVECLHGGHLDDARRLIDAYLGVIDRISAPTGTMQSELCSNLIVLVVATNATDLQTILFDRLMPERVVHTGLAFNVACLWATRGEREQMLEAVRLAVELGKPAENFLRDSDFAAFVDDPGFLEALERCW